MKSEQILTLLGALRDANGPMGGGDLARALGLSSHAFKRELASIRPDLAAHGCEVVGKTGRGNGYELHITDQDVFDRYLSVILPERARVEGRDYNDQENRVHFIIWHLLAPHHEYVRMDELASEMLVSRAQLSKDLTIVRDRLAYYGIRIVSRPRHGSCVEGDEVAVRLCLSDTLREDFHVKGANTSLSHLARPAYHRETLGRIEQIVVRDARVAGYALTDAIVQNLMIHLYVAARRVRAGHQLVLDEMTRAELAGTSELELAHTIAAHMEQTFGISLNEDEVCYIAMHLSSKRIASAEALDASVAALVDDMLAAVNKAYRIDLTADEQLRTTMGLHTAPLLKRLKYGLVFPNPLLQEIRESLMFSYDVAACACEVINEAYGCRLAEDEIAYYALHFKVAIEAQRKALRRRVLVVTSGGRGNAELVRFGIEHNVGDRVAHMDVCNAFELPYLCVDGYDCVLTTVPITDDLPVPTFRINPLFDDESVAIAREALAVPHGHAEAGHYFVPELFFSQLDAADKNDAIAQMCAAMKIVAHVPDDLLSHVLEREELQSSRFGVVAVPSMRGVACERTAIAIATLAHPVSWDGGKVQVVVLMCLGEDFMTHNRGYYRFLRKLIADPICTGRLLRTPTYETLLGLFADTL